MGRILRLPIMSERWVVGKQEPKGNKERGAEGEGKRTKNKTTQSTVPKLGQESQEGQRGKITIGKRTRRRVMVNRTDATPAKRSEHARGPGKPTN